MTSVERAVADARAIAEVLVDHEQNQAAIQSRPEYLTRDPGEGVALEQAARLRVVAESIPAFAKAKSLADAGWLVAALDDHGRPVEGLAATADEMALAAFFAQHPDSVPAAACGPEARLFAVDAGHPKGTGIGLLRSLCREPPPPGYVRDREESEPRPPGWMRDHLGAGVNLIEAVPLRGPRRRFTMAPPVTDAMRQEMLDFVRPMAPPQRLILVWTYPVGATWKLPKAGALIGGELRVLAGVPAEGTAVELGGKRWNVANRLGRVFPLPDWLATGFGGKVVSPEPAPVGVVLNTVGRPD